MATETYNYRGTKITGTSTTAKTFPKSGLTGVKAKEKYLNTSEGHVYQCTTAGSKYEYHKTKDTKIKSGKDYYTKSGSSYHKVSNPKKSDLKKYYERKTVKGDADTAKWKYLHTIVVKKPTEAVKSLGAPARDAGSYTLRANWTIYDSMIKKTSGSRMTDLDITWRLGIVGQKNDPKATDHRDNVAAATSSSINLNNLKIGSKTYTRELFHPFKGKPKLGYVTVTVVGSNEKGNSPSATATRDFTNPADPSISSFAFNEHGEVSCTITTPAGAGSAERYDTWYRMEVYYSETEKTFEIHDSTTTSTSKSLVWDDGNYAKRAYGEYARVRVYAQARGFNGVSSKVSRDYYVAYPNRPEITDVEVSGKTSASRAIIHLKTNDSTWHPVDEIKLQTLVNCEYATDSQIPADADWVETDVVDDAKCTAMSLTVGELMPERGNHTWVRLKSYHANENVLYRFSNPFRIDALYTPAATAADDRIKIESVTAGSDGRSAVVNLVWNDGALPSTGTELSWDSDVNAWKSTKAPQEYTFTWDDGTKEISGETWRKATITIKDLDEATKYYIKARRYNEGDETTYSAYSSAQTVITSEIPESIVAMAERYVPRGSGVTVNWTFAGNAVQKKWQIYNTVKKTVITSGTGSANSVQIPSSRLQSNATNNNVTFVVQVSTGGDWVTSDTLTVSIISPPTLTVSSQAVMTEQDYDITAVASTECDLVVIVTSNGIVSQFPDGIHRQTKGDTMHSEVYSPQWIQGYALTQDTEYGEKVYYEKTGNVYTVVMPESEDGEVDPSTDPHAEGWYEKVGGVSATITLPQMDVWDLGRYTISVTAIDRKTNLHSPEATADFAVAWSHQAPSITPTETYTLTEDTAVNLDKSYYEYNSTTQAYALVDPEGTENPAEENWYERSVTEYVTITPIDTVDDGGFHHMAAQINLTPPPNADPDDVYDIYRMTGDGARLIGYGFPQTFQTVDEYAPFSESGTNHYRIATRTADGDVQFSDVEYVLFGDGIRLDWQGGYTEYPYSIDISDSYQKDVDIRKHLDGTINGYWNQGIERKGSLSTDVIKLIQQDDIDLTRQLARYTGAVYVRTREGTAFEADVQISNIASKNIAVMSIAIDATEIDLTQEFMLPTPFTLEPEEEQEG